MVCVQCGMCACGVCVCEVLHVRVRAHPLSFSLPLQVDRLMELHFKYLEAVQLADKRIEGEKHVRHSRMRLIGSISSVSPDMCKKIKPHCETCRFTAARFTFNS